MEISPGIELVWNLAGHEAITARMEKIEPEHFFCALLKFSELEDDRLEAVVTRSQVAKVLITERDSVRTTLEKRSLPTTRVRHRLRQALGRGNYRHEGEAVHRSTASRELFNRAAKVARKDKGTLESDHLLRVLLEEPTPAMAEVMEDVGVKTPSAEPPAETPLLSRYAQDLLEVAKARRFRVPQARLPQVQVLTLALQSTDPAPILLICAPQVDAAPIVGCAAQELKGQKRIAGVDHVTMLREAEDVGTFANQMADLLAESADTENLVLFTDAVEQGMEGVSPLLSALKPALTDPTPRLVVAVSAEIYHDVVEPDLTLGGVFQTIWLHELAEGEVPAEL